MAWDTLSIHLRILLILFINRGVETVGLRELIAANPEHTHLETHTKTKEVKKLAEEPGLAGAASILLQPTDSLVLDTKEEFYDALMIEDPEEDEEDNEAQKLFSKQRVGDKPLRSFNSEIQLLNSFSTLLSRFLSR